MNHLLLATVVGLPLLCLTAWAADPGVIPSTAPTTAPAPKPVVLPPIPTQFRHEGLMINRQELQAVRKRIEAGQEPWKTALEHVKGTKYASLKYKPRPRETVSSGFLGAGGAAGGSYDQNDDSIAAYTQILLWNLTGEEQYAKNAVEILNAWSILKSHEGPNWTMMAQWTGSMFAQAAELTRATYPGWKPDDIPRFSRMLETAYLPILHNRLLYGNRELGKVNAMMAIGVFNNDRAAFAEAISHWISYVPTFIYLKEDGPEPVRPSYWLTSPGNEELARLNQGIFPDVSTSWIFKEEEVRAFMKKINVADDRTAHIVKYDPYLYWNKAPKEAFVDGLCAETFRDLGHADLGFYQLINAAEIAWRQGIDLYSIHANRLTAFMELHADLRIGEDIPKVFYRVQELGIPATYEIAYNHFHNRLGIALPKTRRLLEQAIRPAYARKGVESPGWYYIDPGSGLRASSVNPAGLAIAWETLTHAELGGGSTPPAGK